MNNILIISPKFFNIEQEIEHEFALKGYNTYLENERINETNLDKIMIRKFPNLYKRKINAYYNKIFKKVKDEKINFVLIIKAETVPIWFLDSIKSVENPPKLIHYMYDPIKNYPNILNKAKYFDRNITFDYNDHKKYDWFHLPLFYSKNIEKIANEAQVVDCKYDFSFIGTLHSDRWNVINHIFEKNKEFDINKSFIYFYIPSKIRYFFEKNIQKKFKNIDKRFIHFDPLNYDEVIDIMLKSKAIIDIHHDVQSGLTNRTIEAIGLNRKIFTTNPFIKCYDFYCKNNIYVFDKEFPKISIKWLNNELIEYSNKNKYNVQNFVFNLENILKGI